MHDWVRQAVEIAKQMPGVPVKLLWSREEDMLHGRYHPVTQCKMTAGLDAQGNVTALHMRIAGQSILAGVFPQNIRNGMDPVAFQGLNPRGEAAFGYSVPNLLIDHAMRNPHVPPGFWRGVNLNQNTVYLECFIDEVAHATRQDPLALRRQLLSQAPRHLAVLNLAAEKAGWGRPLPAGRARGVALHESFGSIVAQVAEVSLQEGKPRVHRVVCAVDCGTVVNPGIVAQQMESAVVFALTAVSPPLLLERDVDAAAVNAALRAAATAGPLAGLHAGMRACTTELIVTAPCDSPFLPLDLVARLHAAMESEIADLAVVRTGGFAQPVFALYSVALLPSLTAFLESGGRKIDTWYSAHRVAEVEFDDETAFANINTIDELQSLERD